MRLLLEALAARGAAQAAEAAVVSAGLELTVALHLVVLNLPEVEPNHKVISLLCHDCNFGTVMNCNANIFRDRVLSNRS